MKKRANASEAKQAGELLFTARQLMLPMIEGIIHSRRELFGWVQQVAISALKELFELDVVQLAGPKGGKHAIERSHYRWGSAAITLPFGGRRMAVGCPRLRGLDGAEAQLQSVVQFRAADPVPTRVLNQILLGVSSRGYEKSLGPAPAAMVVRGRARVRRAAI